MNIDSIIPVIHPDSYQFYITVGLPGVGKSTFCERLASLCPAENVAIISRDALRTKILERMRRVLSQQEIANQDLDNRVSREVVAELKYYLRSRHSVRIIIFDGCHTDYSSLKWLVLKITRRMSKLIIGRLFYEINLCLVGTPDSWCSHKLTNKQPGDYSDYQKDGKHNAIPRAILEIKRNQYRNLLQHGHIHEIASNCNHFILIPDNDSLE